MEIEVGEYVRTKDGCIFKATEYWIYDCEVKTESIVSHSKNIIDLIEVGDVLKLKDGEKWEVQEHQGDGNWIQTEWEVIENEEDLKNKVDSILTKEQFSSIEYII